MITQFEYDEIQRDIKADKFETESPSVIQAIVEAREILNETGLSPRQLLAERSENMAKLAEAIQQRDALISVMRNFCNWAMDVKNGADLHPGRLEDYRIGFAETIAKTSKEGV